MPSRRDSKNNLGANLNKTSQHLCRLRRIRMNVAKRRCSFAQVITGLSGCLPTNIQPRFANPGRQMDRHHVEHRKTTHANQNEVANNLCTHLNLSGPLGCAFASVRLLSATSPKGLPAPVAGRGGVGGAGRRGEQCVGCVVSRVGCRVWPVGWQVWSRVRCGVWGVRTEGCGVYGVGCGVG